MSSRGLALIAVALVLSGGVLGVQLASGGADFVPQGPADPCQDRGRTGRADLEGLVETVVLTGFDEAACTLGVSRERLLLAVPFARDRAALAREIGTDERGIAQAIGDGLRTGVDRLERAGRLPRTSTLLPEIGDELGVPQRLVDLLPDGVVDDLLPTAGVLRWAIDRIDVNAVLADVDGGTAPEKALRDALVKGAVERIKGSVRDALPGPLQGLLD